MEICTVFGDGDYLLLPVRIFEQHLCGGKTVRTIAIHFGDGGSGKLCAESVPDSFNWCYRGSVSNFFKLCIGVRTAGGEYPWFAESTFFGKAVGTE